CSKVVGEDVRGVEKGTPPRLRSGRVGLRLESFRAASLLLIANTSYSRPVDPPRTSGRGKAVPTRRPWLSLSHLSMTYAHFQAGRSPSWPQPLSPPCPGQSELQKLLLRRDTPEESWLPNS